MRGRDSLQAALPVALGVGERLFGETSDKKPMRLDAVTASWTMGSEENGPAQDRRRMSTEPG